MKKIVITIILLFVLLSTATAQEAFRFGFRANMGLFGLKYPPSYELTDEVLRKKDSYTQNANFAFAGGVLVEYTFYRKNDFRMSLQTELGYTYTSFQKVWGFKKDYDTDFVSHASELEIIHNLKALYLSLPIRGSMQYKRWKGSLGVAGSRIFSATADRNARSRVGVPLSEWEDSKTHWRTTKIAGDQNQIQTPYLSNYFTWQGMMSLEYQFTKNIFIGLEARRFFNSPTLYIYTVANQDDRRGFYYKGDMLSISFVYLY